MSKIENLTPEQESQLDAQASKWIDIGLSTQNGEMDKSRIEQLIAAAYAVEGLAAPLKVLFVSSPLEAVDILKTQYGVTASDISSSIFYSSLEAGWLSYYSAFRDVVGLKEETEDLVPLIELSQLTGPIFMFDELCIVSEKARVIHTNAAGGLHCTNGPAIQFGEGPMSLKVYALNDVVMPEWLFATPKEQLNPAEIMRISNVEQRAEGIKWYGMQNLLHLLKSEVLDKTDEHGYELLQVELGEGLTAKYLKMQNPSTPEIHIEGVGDDCMTIEDADRYRQGPIANKYGYEKVLRRA